jgi:hypothetical protein
MRRLLGSVVVLLLARGAAGAGPAELAVQTAPPAAHDATAPLDPERLPLESRTSVVDTVGRYVPGATLTADGGLRLLAGRPQDTAATIDGVRTDRLVLPPGMVERVAVIDAGYGADQADVAGGLVQVGTRSAASDLRVGVDLFHELRDRQSTVLAPVVSGPLWSGELSYVLAGRGELIGEQPAHDPTGAFPDPPRTRARALSGGLKVTWMPEPRQRFDALLLMDENRRDNGGGFDVAPEAQPAHDSRGLLASLRWMATFASGVSVRAHLAHLRDSSEELPVLCRTRTGDCDSVAPSLQLVPRTSLYANWIRHSQDQRSAWEAAGLLEAPVAGAGPVTQRLRASSRLRPGGLSARQLVPGNRFVEWNARSPERQSETFANDPRFEAGQGGVLRSQATTFETVHSVEDEVSLGRRLTVTPGLALVTSRVNGEGTTVQDGALLPGIGVRWDATGDGRTWLRASSYRRAGSDADGLARFVLGAPLTRDCRWSGTGNVFGRDCQFSGGRVGRTLGLACGPDGVAADGSPCGVTPGTPRFWEHSLGLARALPRGLTFTLDGVYRRADGVPAVRETNRFAAAGSDAGDYRSGRAQDVLDWSGAPGSFSRAMGVTAAVHRRAGAVRALVAYTLGRIETQAGDAPDDRRHALRALLTCDLRQRASLGVAYRLDSGAPVPQLAVSSPGRPPGDDYRARVGIVRNIDVDTSGTAGGHGPITHSLDLQARAAGRPLLGVDLDFYLDVINVLATRMNPLAAADGPDFGVLAAAPDRRWFRLGVGYHY